MLYGPAARRLHELIRQGYAKSRRPLSISASALKPSESSRDKGKGKEVENEPIDYKGAPQNPIYHDQDSSSFFPVILGDGKVTRADPGPASIMSLGRRTDLSALKQVTGGPNRARPNRHVQAFLNIVFRREGWEDVWGTWDLFVAVETENVMFEIPNGALMAFASSLASAIMNAEISPNTANSQATLATRLKCIIDLLDTRRSSLRPDTPIEAWRCTALIGLGNLEEAQSLMASICQDYRNRYEEAVMETLNYLIEVLGSQKPAESIVSFVHQAWPALHFYVRNIGRGYTSYRVKAQGDRLRDLLMSILDTINDPMVWVAERSAEWNNEELTHTIVLFLHYLLRRERFDETIEILKAAIEMPPSEAPEIPTMLRLKIARSLAANQRLDEAQLIFNTCSAPGPDSHPRDQELYLFTALHLAAREGNVEEAAKHLGALEKIGKASFAAQSLLLLTYQRAGDIPGMLQLWDEFHRDRAGPPPPSHFQVVLQAYAKKGNVTKFNEWLQRLLSCGHGLTLGICSTILTIYVQQKDVGAATALLKEMRRLGLNPDNVCYTLILTLLADQGDPVSAERLLRSVMKEGPSPDPRMLNTLMDAHVQARSWAGVVRVFDFIESRRRRAGARYSIDVFNILLKALVRIGAPFSVVADHWRRLETISLKPDAYTWCLLIQSACDAGRMDIAEDIFKEMDEIRQEIGTASHLNAFVMTTIMSGFLRNGETDRAKEVYDEMLVRGIQPLTATFSKIIRAYATEGSEDGLQLAEEFLAGIKQGQLKDVDWALPVGHVTTFDAVYGPLMDAYGKKLRVEDVERLYNTILEEGGEGTINMLTLLLDAYRRTNNLEGVQHIWPQLYERVTNSSNHSELLASATQTSSEDVQSRGIREHRGSKLCVPLSIYIDALSWAGLHSDIAAVWKQVRDDGFAFDPSNWNHLSCCLVRAGEVERAFEVVERVLLPFDDRLRQEKRKSRDRVPKDVFVYDVEDGPLDSGRTSTFHESIGEDRRTESQKLIERHTRHRDTLSLDEEESYSTDTLSLEGDGLIGSGSDFARPLYVLQQLYPTWNMWRPHIATLAHLSWAIAHLGGGQLLTPIKPVQDVEVEAPNVPLDPFAERMQAHNALDRIHERFPRTIHMVRHWNGTAEAANVIRDLAQRLGGTQGRDRYSSPSTEDSLD